MNTKHQIEIFNNPNKYTIVCQMCSTNHPDIYMCNACYSFACMACAKNHTCLSHNKPILCEPQFKKIERKNSKGIELVKKTSQSSKSKITDTWICCQRCLSSSATKECCQCKINYYCQNCFKAIHNSKFYNHSFVTIKDQSGNKANNQYKVKITLPKNLSKRLFQPETNTPSNKEQMFESLQSNLLVSKDSLQLQYLAYQNELNNFLISIQHSFEQLIEDLKLKMFQITTKIKDQQQTSILSYQTSKQSISKQLNKIANLRTAYGQQSSYSLPFETITAKLQTNTKEIQQMLKEKQFYPYDKFCTQINQQIGQIKLKIQRIELKKVIHFEGIKSSLNDSVCQSDKNTSHSHKNESKKLKTLLNLNSYKSTDKLTPFQLGINSPKKTNMNSKALHQFSTINKSFFIQTFNSPSQLKQKQVDKCLTLNPLKDNGKEKNTQKERKVLVTNLMSPKTTKKLNPNIQNVSKSNLVKAGIKIEKTKKMISDIRNEMMEFTNRFTFQKQGSKTSLQGNSQSLDVSQLSIQSCVASREDLN